MTEPLPIAIPSATLVIFRERTGGKAPELLMVERAKAMVFAGGALVFPGGRVDLQDRALAATIPGDADENAHRIAAVRETIEEAGLSIGLDPSPGAPALAAMRQSLHEGTAFAQALATAGATLAIDALIPFARWRPAHADMRIFDTRFYLARLPADAPDATVDLTENTRLLWATATDVLAEADAGRATIIYPTRRNLERLARFDSFAAAVADARAHPVRTITPYLEERGGRSHLCIPDGFGYPVTAKPMGSALRG